MEILFAQIKKSDQDQNPEPIFQDRIRGSGSSENGTGCATLITTVSVQYDSRLYVFYVCTQEVNFFFLKY